MNDTATIPDLVLFEEVMAEVEPPCESVHHGTSSPLSRYHAGGAAWVQIGQCSHTTGLRCDSWAQHVFARRLRDPHYGWDCGICGHAREPGSLIPLERF